MINNNKVIKYALTSDLLNIILPYVVEGLSQIKHVHKIATKRQTVKEQ